ncbi:hypothetical protein D3C72_2150360 [compost metagenome]
MALQPAAAVHVHVAHAQRVLLVGRLCVRIDAAVAGHDRVGQGAQQNALDAHEVNFPAGAALFGRGQLLDQPRRARPRHHGVGEERVDVRLRRVG